MAEQLTYEKVLELFKETDKKFKDTDKKFKDTDKKFKDTDKRIEESLKKSREEFDEELKQSRKEFDERMKKLDGKFGNILGSFVEGLIEPKLKELFIARNIPLREVHKNIEIYNNKNEKQAEIDLLLVNKEYSLAVEIKTTLTVEDVKNHIQRLDKLQKYPIRTILNTKLLGAVAGIKIESDADKYAYRQGLFVLKQKGEIVEIANDEKFQPKEWKIE